MEEIRNEIQLSNMQTYYHCFRTRQTFVASNKDFLVTLTKVQKKLFQEFHENMDFHAIWALLDVKSTKNLAVSG